MRSQERSQCLLSFSFQYDETSMLVSKELRNRFQKVKGTRRTNAMHSERSCAALSAVTRRTPRPTRPRRSRSGVGRGRGGSAAQTRRLRRPSRTPGRRRRPAAQQRPASTSWTRAARPGSPAPVAPQPRPSPSREAAPPSPPPTRAASTPQTPQPPTSPGPATRAPRAKPTWGDRGDSTQRPTAYLRATRLASAGHLRARRLLQRVPPAQAAGRPRVPGPTRRAATHHALRLADARAGGGDSPDAPPSQRAAPHCTLRLADTRAGAWFPCYPRFLALIYTAAAGNWAPAPAVGPGCPVLLGLPVTGPGSGRARAGVAAAPP